MMHDEGEIYDTESTIGTCLIKLVTMLLFLGFLWFVFEQLKPIFLQL